MIVQKTEATMLVQEKNPLEKARSRADRAVAKSDSPSAMFEKVISAFSIGDLSFSDLQSSVTRLLKDGAAPDELLRVLRWRESIEPLPEEARDKIIAMLNEVMPSGPAERAGVQPSPAPTAAVADSIQPPVDDEPDTSAMSRLIEEFAAAWDAEPKARPTPSAAPAPEGNGQNVDYKAMLIVLGQREDDLAALQAEHSRVLGLLEARARSAAQLQEEMRELSAQFDASRGALETQQGKTREIEEVLAERIAAEEAARARADQARNEEAVRRANLHEKELSALRESLAARDASVESMRGTVAERDAALEQFNRALAGRDGVIEQARALLAERDAQIATLQSDHAKLAPAVESGAQLAAKLQVDLAAAQARVVALEAEVASNQAASSQAVAVAAAPAAAPAAKEESDAWAAKLQALQRSLDESNTAIEAQKQQHSKIVSALMTRSKSTENDLKAARARIEAMASELQGRDREAAAAREREREQQQEQVRQQNLLQQQDLLRQHDVPELEPDLEQTMPLLPVAETPAPGLRLRRGVEISDFFGAATPADAGSRVNLEA